MCGESETLAVSAIRRRQAEQLRNPEAIVQAPATIKCGAAYMSVGIWTAITFPRGIVQLPNGSRYSQRLEAYTGSENEPANPKQCSLCAEAGTLCEHPDSGRNDALT